MNSKIQLLGASGASVAAIAMAAYFPIFDAPAKKHAYSTSMPDDGPNAYGVEETPEAKVTEKPKAPITVAPIVKEKPIKATPTPKVTQNRHRRQSYRFSAMRRVETRVSQYPTGRPSEGRHRSRTSSYDFTWR